MILSKIMCLTCLAMPIDKGGASLSICHTRKNHHYHKTVALSVSLVKNNIRRSLSITIKLNTILLQVQVQVLTPCCPKTPKLAGNNPTDNRKPPRILNG